MFSVNLRCTIQYCFRYTLDNMNVTVNLVLMRCYLILAHLQPRVLWVTLIILVLSQLISICVINTKHQVSWSTCHVTVFHICCHCTCFIKVNEVEFLLTAAYFCRHSQTLFASCYIPYGWWWIIFRGKFLVYKGFANVILIQFLIKMLKVRAIHHVISIVFVSTFKKTKVLSFLRL